MLKTILSVHGRPGLFKLISKGKNMLIIESLVDKQRIPVYTKDKVISLGDISVYTKSEEVPLRTILTSVKDKENGQKVSLNLPTAKPDELRAYMEEILPEFNRERVYPSDIRKLLSWYNLLISSGITDFAPEEKPQEAQDVQEAQEIQEAQDAQKEEQ
ncbi:MAG: DUF5606 domain-containing protein [Tannerellaceae bacterium]|jgi:hypothetical protein|nr:DUF5606 domain-containing protein [Tannerellaceae bacterium]